MGGLLTGCAFSRTPVKVGFTPRVDQPLAAARKAALEVGPVKDSRLVLDQYVLIQKANAYGTTSGAYVTEKPVAEIFRDGLTAALQQNGFETANTNRYVLRSDLQNFGLGAIQNVFSPATIKSWLTVRFELVDQTTLQPVWHETYEGQDTTQASWETGEFIAQEFSKVADVVVSQLISDRSFRAFFE